MSSAHELRGLARVLARRQGPPLMIVVGNSVVATASTREVGACVLAICADCRWPYNPLTVACGCLYCPECLVESDDVPSIGCRSCSGLPLLCPTRALDIDVGPALARAS